MKILMTTILMTVLAGCGYAGVVSPNTPTPSQPPDANHQVEINDHQESNNLRTRLEHYTKLLEEYVDEPMGLRCTSGPGNYTICTGGLHIGYNLCGDPGAPEWRKAAKCNPDREYPVGDLEGEPNLILNGRYAGMYMCDEVVQDKPCGIE